MSLAQRRMIDPGNSGKNRIHGHDGNDLLMDAGDDIIIGGDGQDFIIGGTGNDV